MNNLLASVSSNVGAGIHTFRYHNENLKIVVDHLLEEKRSLYGELTVFRYEAVIRDWERVRHEGFNLLSGPTRQRIAKMLANEIPSVPIWPAIIEEISREVVIRQREGQPVVQAKDIPQPESIKWRLEPVLISKAPTLVYGFGGSGKSMLAAFWATVIREGYLIHGLEPEPGNVLYLDYESTEADFRRRVDAIHRGLDLETNSTIYYRRCSQKLSADIHEIQRVVLEKEIDVVIVDTAGPACGGDPENAASSIQFFMALRSLNTTSLVLAHKSKAKESRGPFGSVFWENYPRAVYYLKSDLEPDGDTVYVGMTHEKGNEGRRQKPRALALRFTDTDDGQTATFTPVDVSEIPAFETDLSTNARITNALKSGKHTAKELEEALEMSYRKVYDALTYGRRKGTFDMDEDKRWYLPTTA